MAKGLEYQQAWWSMTKIERRNINKIGVKELRVLYEKLIDEMRGQSTDKVTSMRSYDIGWNDGYNVARRRYPSPTKF